jgi:hypothetical protein
MLVIAGKPKVGRVQHQIRRAFIACGGRPLTIADLLPPLFSVGELLRAGMPQRRMSAFGTKRTLRG